MTTDEHGRSRGGKGRWPQRGQKSEVGSQKPIWRRNLHFFRIKIAFSLLGNERFTETDVKFEADGGLGAKAERLKS